MNTTDLLVEYLIVGAVADIWLALLVLAVIPFNSTALPSIVDSADKLSALLVIPFLAITYVLGGVMNFVAPRLLRAQKRFRDELFHKAGWNYNDARGLLFQKASPDAMSRFRSDGHIIRVARTSTLNFLCLAAALLVHVRSYPLSVVIGFIVCILVSIASFFQWTARYKSNYTEMLEIYKVLRVEFEREQRGKKEGK